jgi:hypothetical protein
VLSKTFDINILKYKRHNKITSDVNVVRQKNGRTVSPMRIRASYLRATNWKTGVRFLTWAGNSPLPLLPPSLSDRLCGSSSLCPVFIRALYLGVK